MRTIHFVSLGCPKNRVDSEVMLGVAEEHGYTHVAEAEAADVIVVNTCGFIDSAKQESIDTILELSAHKQAGRCKKLVVSGCLSQRYPTELAEGLPEVDHFLGSSDMLKLGPVLAGEPDRLLVGSPAEWLVSASSPRRRSTRGRSAYVKIAEGCNRSCSFCVIPELRGKQRSRLAEDVVQEVEGLARSGVVEINLVSQDTIAYGRDRGETDGALADLVRSVAEVPGIRWVRLFYLYPERLTDDIIELIAGHPRVVPYLDMPLQHVSDPILRAMRRGHGGDRIRRLVERVRARIPGVTFRTAFIVGHPGETEEHFRELCELIGWAEFERLGVFLYSDEPSSHSFTLPDKVPREVAEERRHRALELQRSVSLRKNRALIGTRLPVLVEGVSEESELVMVGRHPGQAPEIDGSVFLAGAPVLPGQWCEATVTDCRDYDLVAEVDEDTIETPEIHQPEIPELVVKNSDGRRIALRVHREA